MTPDESPYAAPASLTLPSGCTIAAPGEWLLAFCAEEYAYYDGIASWRPAEIEPVDVLVTVAMNSRIDTATKVRAVHRGLAERCNPLLAAIPAEADLRVEDPALERVGELLHEAVQVPGVLIPVATKVLHRKRRRLIPMLDTVLLGYYLAGERGWYARSQDGRRAAQVALDALERFRTDLQASHLELQALQQWLSTQGYELSLVRIMELLLWMAVEPRGYYRATS